MTHIPFSIHRFTGVDATSDPYLLGRETPTSASLAHNFRSRKGGARTLRGGYREVSPGSELNKSGLYFPAGSAVVFPYQLMPSAFNVCGMMATGGSSVAIEFWYKQGYSYYERYVCYNPYIIVDGYRHMGVVMYPVEPDTSTDAGTQSTGVRFEFVTTDGVGGSASGNAYKFDGVPADGAWHHLAILREGDTTFKVYVDGSEAGSMKAVATDAVTSNNFPNYYELVHTPLDQNINIYPLFGNCLVLGLDNGALAEFRIWDERRFPQDILDYKDVSLVKGGDDYPVFYAPLDEAFGKRPVERLYEVSGYFTPSEPYVNDENELVFNGWDSLAIPSVASSPSPSQSALYDEKTTDAHYLNEDGSVHGGILWDRCLYNVTGAADPDYLDVSSDADAYDALGMGVFQGVAQVRFKLQQLSEGVIAGRLGIVWDGVTQKYQLFFCNTTHGTTFRCSATAGHNIDTSWIGVEKTVTVFFNGDGSNSGAGDCEIYVDNTEATLSYGTLKWNDKGTGTYNVASGDYACFVDNLDVDDNDTDGAIGGSVSNPQNGIALDLIFLRQWWDDHSYETNAELVSATYDQETLPERDRFFAKNMTGELDSLTFSSLNIDGLSAFSVPDEYQNRKYISIPYSIGMNSSDDIFTVLLESTTAGGGHFVKRILRWGDSGDIGDGVKVFSTPYSITALNSFFGDLGLSGITLSNLVNDINARSFRDNASERLIFTDKLVADLGGDIIGYVRNPRLVEVIEDDSPLQGSMKIGGSFYKTRFFELSGGSSGGSTPRGSIYEQRTMRPQWCHGPIAYASGYPMVQAISRYTSNDGKINKLLLSAASKIYELDEATGTLTQMDKGHLDSDIGKVVKSVGVSDKIIFYGDTGAIKMNYKGNFSRLGIDRPVSFRFLSMSATDDDPGISGLDSLVGYTCQSYDNENQVYSGTLPVFFDNKTHIHYVDGNTGDEEYVLCVKLAFRGNDDENSQYFRVFKTRDMNDAGSEGIMHLCASTKCTQWETEFEMTDRTEDAVLVNETVLSSNYYGQSNVPPVCDAMAIGYGRLFLFDLSVYSAGFAWSDVDGLGLPVPDQVPLSNYGIVEEGTSKTGKALQEYQGVLYAFKEDAIFRIVNSAPGNFGAQLVYKGVGVLNQNCVIVAGNTMFMMDTNGIYAFTQGEPTLASTGFIDYFSNFVNQTQLPDRAFALHHKKDDLLLFFVPSVNSTYCDRCIVLDLRSGIFTLDIVPHVTCGFVDGDTVYLGTPYGKVLEYDPNTYVDVADDVITGTATISSDGDTLEGMADSLAQDGSLLGAPVYVVDTTNKRIWHGTLISEDDSDEVTVDAWTAIFNDNGSDPSGTVTYYIGYIFGHEKTPFLTLSSLAVPNPMWLRSLKEVEFLSSDFTNVETMFTSIALNNNMSNTSDSLSPTGRETKVDIVSGMHKNFQMEYALLADGPITMQNITYYIAQDTGRQNG
jgi:hypothetical protein